MAGDKLHKAAVTLGKRGGEKGGPARAKALSQSQREQIGNARSKGK